MYQSYGWKSRIHGQRRMVWYPKMYEAHMSYNYNQYPPNVIGTDQKCFGRKTFFSVQNFVCSCYMWDVIVSLAWPSLELTFPPNWLTKIQYYIKPVIPLHHFTSQTQGFGIFTNCVEERKNVDSKSGRTAGVLTYVEHWT